MRLRPILEVVVVIGVLGLCLEVVEAHTWVMVAAGAAAAIWLMARSH
ncbi:MAG: hypothetical protein H7A49_13110 [Akkermansiaceae bacterium]|nr:hypothetical protein [Akkermansiaceae bacterium]MCP5544834.1 hypothetical protein [Akkermansiaceae bacterium]